jgi:hypothetical protein
MVGRPFKPVLLILGIPVDVALFPCPLLSFHPVRRAVGPTYVVVSAASSHRVHPGTENPDTLNVFPLLDRSDHDVTPPVVADTVIVEVACASNHTAKFDRRDGLNRSLFMRDMDILLLLVILHS